MNPLKPVIVLTGPTGIGKSRVVAELPDSAPIEIINADSRQIYKGLMVGTATPSPEEQKRFPHHLFSFLEPTKTFSAGQYIKLCKPLITEIHDRGKIPLIIGGTFFYIRALWDGLIETADIDPEIENRVNAMPREEAYAQLLVIDPVRASSLAPADEYRIKRSLMVCLNTQQPISMLEKSGGTISLYDYHSFYLDIDRGPLYERINRRVEAMFDAGLLDEIAGLLASGYTPNDPALKSIGYREVLELTRETGIEPPDWPDDLKQRAIDVISKETRNFAKRQLTWFRNEERLKRIDPTSAVSLISGLILEQEKNKRNI